MSFLATAGALVSQDLAYTLISTILPGFARFWKRLSPTTLSRIYRLLTFAGLVYSIPSVFRYFLGGVLPFLLKHRTWALSFNTGARDHDRLTRFLVDQGHFGAGYRLCNNHDLDDDSDNDDEEFYSMNTISKEKSTIKSSWSVSSSGRCKMRFTPEMQSRRFFRRYGKLFLYSIESAKMVSGDKAYTEYKGVIYCFSRSKEALLRLVTEALDHYEMVSATRTSIVRPATAKIRELHSSAWASTSRLRRNRALASVILKDCIKTDVLKDIEEYLSPSAKQWYAARGLPYRRGYLFVGPPGTGKTSLAFALAGHFQLEIFFIPLNDPSLNEEDLARLFDELPSRCMVLLEDIDVAGLQTRRNISRDINAQQSNVDHAEDQDAENDTRHTTTTKPRISLSGFLNMIDGVCAVEGRVLIMTTNDASNLDAAMTRPGRIDYKVSFQLASCTDAQQIFIEIFENQELPRGGSLIVSNVDNTTVDSQYVCATQHTKSGIQALASKFASYIPEQRFAQAELQGYMVKYKNRPEDAVSHIEAWVAEQLASGDNGTDLDEEDQQDRTNWGFSDQRGHCSSMEARNRSVTVCTV